MATYPPKATTATKALFIFLRLCITLPIFYWLCYAILVRVQATELMFFLFYVYVPVDFLSFVLIRILVKEN